MFQGILTIVGKLVTLLQHPIHLLVYRDPFHDSPRSNNVARDNATYNASKAQSRRFHKEASGTELSDTQKSRLANYRLNNVQVDSLPLVTSNNCPSSRALQLHVTVLRCVLQMDF